MQKSLYPTLCLVFFAAGAYVWQIRNTGFNVSKGQAAAALEDFRGHSIIVEVDGEKLTQEDIEWEYQLLTTGALDKETLTPIPDLGSRYHQELKTLRKQLVANLIERKVLYAYVKQDKEFTFDDPARYSDCLSAWQQAQLRGSGELIQSREDRNRLKSRLCERSLLDQYMRERVFSSVNVTEAEIVEYYKNHTSDFRKPERVVIRQILLPDEASARKARHQVTAQNFAQLAEELSIAPEGAQGGKLGPFSKGAMPNVFDVAFQLRKGEISDILKSPYGYHIMMILDRLPKTEQGLDEVHDKIAATIRKKKEEDEYQKWVEQALAAINISIPKPLW